MNFSLDEFIRRRNAGISVNINKKHKEEIDKDELDKDLDDMMKGNVKNKSNVSKFDRIRYEEKSDDDSGDELRTQNSVE